MTVQKLHSWTLDPAEAASVQERLRDRLVLTWENPTVRAIAGVDVSIQEDLARAAIAVFRFPELTPLAGVIADAPLVFPYIPGLLAFREGPAVLAAWEKLAGKPDLLMFDGQGIAHPRGMGIASLMGLWLDRPTIGVAKSRLYGRYTEPGLNPGDRSDLFDPRNPGRVIGVVLRTRARSRPLFISPGHRID
ncbi:MAG TPA: endonuclease V, partial [Anaerolineaceae bacterium]|nr:endonuclease V [Anaerolineaceae bacterium]